MADETPSADAPEVTQPAPAAAEAEPAAAPAAEAPEAAPAEAEAVADTADTADAAAERRAPRGRGQRYVPSGIAHVNATFNNTRVSITDQHGNVISWSSGGRIGFKGSRKSTSYVAQQVGADAAKRANALGMREVEVRLKGPGAGRESAARGIAAAGLEIVVLKDVTPIPHNGCRPPKRRRV